MEISKIIEFDAGHRIPYHKSACRSVHGHRYKLEATVEGEVQIAPRISEWGMVEDFGEIKLRMMQHIHALFDHCFIAFREDPLIKWFQKMGLDTQTNPSPMNRLGDRYLVKDFGWVQEVPGPPTAENLAKWCYDILFEVLESPTLRMNRVTLNETPNSIAIYRRPQL